MLVAPIVEPGTSELIASSRSSTTRPACRSAGWRGRRARARQTLAIAFKQRQKPQLVKTKYDYLIADAVLSAGEFELASRQARKKAIDVEQVLTDEFQVKIRRSAPRCPSFSACRTSRSSRTASSRWSC